MSFQADYLSNNKNTPYANLVDNIHHPMCEFLQVGVDRGVFGLCCLCVVISVIYCKLRKLQDDGEATTCFVVVLIYSMFSYSLHFPFTWIVIAYSIVPTIKLTKKLRLPICIISSIFSFIILICTIKEIHSDYKWWHLAQKTFFAVSTKDLKEYKTLYLEKTNHHISYSITLPFCTELVTMKKPTKWQKSVLTFLMIMKYVSILEVFVRN